MFLRHIFSKMESHFHGTSSGIDPVCSYTGKTIIREGDSIFMSAIPDFPEGHKLFIVDSKKKAETAPLVKGFKNRLINDSVFASIIEKEMTKLVNICIHSLKTNFPSGFSDSMKKLSRLQLENFDAMIPDTIRQSWMEGLRREIFALKLCGSGGGGFFLGFTENWDRTARFFKQSGKKILTLDL